MLRVKINFQLSIINKVHKRATSWELLTPIRRHAYAPHKLTRLAKVEYYTKSLQKSTGSLEFIMVAITPTTAAGVLALLSEPEPQLKQYALKALIPLVPQFWAEISEHVAFMYVSYCFLFTSSLTLTQIQ